MSKQTYIVEIEDGPETHWLRDSDRLRAVLEFMANDYVCEITSGTRPNVTVTEAVPLDCKDELFRAVKK